MTERTFPINWWRLEATARSSSTVITVSFSALMLIYNLGRLADYRQGHASTTMTRNRTWITFFFPSFCPFFWGRGGGLLRLTSFPLSRRVKYAYEKGHQIASHTWSHPVCTALSVAAQTILNFLFWVSESYDGKRRSPHKSVALF